MWNFESKLVGRFIFYREVKMDLFVRLPTVLFLRFSEAQRGIFSLSRLTKEITIALSN